MGPRGPNKSPELNRAWGTDSGEKQSVSPVLIPCPESSSHGTAGPTRRGGRIWTLESSAAVEIRAVQNRLGPAARARTTLPLLPPGSAGARGAPKGASGPLGFGAPSMKDGRSWELRKGAGEEPNVGLGARPSLSSQTRGRGMKARLQPGLRRSTMAASAAPPGSSCSHALKDSQDLPQGSAFSGTRVRNQWKQKGLECAKCRSNGTVSRVDLATVG